MYLLAALDSMDFVFCENTAEHHTLRGSDNLIPEPWSARSGHRLVQVGTARQRYTCSKNIHFVGTEYALSIAMKLLLLRLKFVFYYKILLLKIELFRSNYRVLRVTGRWF